MSERGRSVLWNCVKYGVSVLCLIYAFRGVPLGDLWAVLSRYPILPMGAVVAVSFVAYAIMGLRLSRMSPPGMGPFSFGSAFGATLACLAVNNVLPAKAGEVAKALWLSRAGGIPFQKTLGMVFMERFFDVNVLALFSLWFLWLNDMRGTVAAFAACLAAGWCLLVLFRRRPDLAERFAGLFGRGVLHGLVSGGLAGVLGNMSPRRVAWLTVTSLATWSCYCAETALSLNSVSELGLSWTGVVSAFAVGGLGMLLPASPGAVGVYEAFMVTALRGFGVEADEALAAALFSHMAQFLPVTVAGGLCCAFFPAPSGESS
ncbi:MAG: flippase-like domain-containing protein [Synergistaceae bacterium]|jgi:uncharacterized membrane protein YbhN (UPF0104 family)|nr:flippase-like domain-containing protein [Synergistaceae bacterium]